MYQVRKRFRDGKGLSCCFRQWRATHSHCQYLHGYEIGVEFLFESETLSDLNWLIDFALIKSLYNRIEELFDHKMIVAESDPFKEDLCALEGLGGVFQGSAAQVTLLPEVGCERFAEHFFKMAKEWLVDLGASEVRLVLCEVSENSKNSAIYMEAVSA
jgi:6-pyruvoyltetrahydropterin/6-carboxytetrahydropterin synthase